MLSNDVINIGTLTLLRHKYHATTTMECLWQGRFSGIPPVSGVSKAPNPSFRLNAFEGLFNPIFSFFPAYPTMSIKNLQMRNSDSKGF